MENTLQENIKSLPYYCFKETGLKRYIEGRFWNHGGKQLAIVAIITSFDERGDWAAYIGTDAPESYTEQNTCEYVAAHGCKLSGKDALHFFPDIKLPYRL